MANFKGWKEEFLMACVLFLFPRPKNEPVVKYSSGNVSTKSGHYGLFYHYCKTTWDMQQGDPKTDDWWKLLVPEGGKDSKEHPFTRVGDEIPQSHSSRLEMTLGSWGSVWFRHFVGLGRKTPRGQWQPKLAARPEQKSIWFILLLCLSVTQLATV